MTDDLLPNGTTVWFPSDGEGSLLNQGVILEYSPEDEKDRAGYLVACYYLVSPDEIDSVEESDEEDQKLHLLARGLMQKCGLDYHAVVELLSNGWRYVEKIGEISRWEHPMWSLNERVVSAPSMYDVLSKPLNG